MATELLHDRRRTLPPSAVGLMQVSDLRSAALAAHRLALFCALLHLAVCIAVAFYTGQWGLVLLIGAPAVASSLWVALTYPETLLSRLAMAACFMALTIVITDQTGSDLEATFSFSIMLSVLVVYCDWRPLVFAYLLITGHHLALEALAVGGFGWVHQGGVGRFIVHGTLGAVQVVSLCYLAVVLRRRVALEAENAALGRSLRSLHDEANRDPLTGLYNRRYLEARVGEIRAVVSHGREAVVVCVVDVDHFKRVNDQYGHAAGDAVLRAVASKLAGSVRQNDVVVRQGGEEFVILLRHCALEPAMERAEEIRCALAAMSTEIGGLCLSVTASFGLAAWTGADGFEDALYLADQALYRAKRRGRNCVQVGTEADRAPAEAAELANGFGSPGLVIEAA